MEEDKKEREVTVGVSARLRKSDKEWLDANNIGITELLTSAIWQRKNEIEGYNQNFDSCRANLAKIQAKFAKALQFMEKKGEIDEWIAIDTSEPAPTEVMGRSLYF